MTLEAGTVIATGTPGGVGDSRDPKRYLEEGEVVEVWVEGVGTLSQPRGEGAVMEQRLSLVTIGVRGSGPVARVLRGAGLDVGVGARPGRGVLPVRRRWSSPCGRASRLRRTRRSRTPAAGAASRSRTTSDRLRRSTRFSREAEAAGATIGRPGAETFWGGYSGVFLDPDGHPWEVAHNPFWTIGDDGSITLPD